MDATFRQSMAWLHTWAGVVSGALLFAIFWMGTLSVFDREIDRWMMPGTRLAASTQVFSLDRAAAVVRPLLPAGAGQWRIDLPTERVPVARFSSRDGAGAGTAVARWLDPVRYELIPDQETEGATGFIFPFHYRLQLTWNDLGHWLVGFAGMAMLVLLLSGVILHRRIFAEFFTFRPQQGLQRSSLDLHKLTGVIGLPFHFVITLSGLIVFIGVYFPQAQQAVYGGGKAAQAAYTAEASGRYRRPPAGTPGRLASLDGMVDRAEREWAGGRVSLVRVWHPGDANSYVELRRSYAQDLTLNLDQIYFDAGSGAVLQRFAAAPVIGVQRLIAGLHMIQFEHWTLRWLYFLAGLSGCVMIATGLLFWIGARRVRHAKRGLAGVRVVEGLAVGAVTGIVIATLAFFAANRLLPPGARFAGQQRAALEMSAFYLVWLASFVHAWWRSVAAWRAQAWAIAALALLCVWLDVVTTAEPLFRPPSATMSTMSTIAAVAGVDALLLGLALLAALGARRLGRPAGPRPIAPARRLPPVMAARR